MKIKSLFTRDSRSSERRTLDLVGEFATFIGPGSEFTGTFRGRENYLVFGRVKGNCEIEGALVLSDAGRWEGNISATYVLIAGEVVGDITAREKLEITPTARIQGNLTSPAIAMAQGASHSGHVHSMMPPVRFSERRTSRPTDD